MMRLLLVLGVLVMTGPTANAQDLSTERSDDRGGVVRSAASPRGDTLAFAAAMTTCAVVSTAIASVALIPEARSQPHAVYVVSVFPGASLAHVDLLACPAIAMALAGPSSRALYAELVLGAALGLLAGGAAGVGLVWPVDQLSRGAPPAASLAVAGALLLGSIGTTLGAIFAYDLHAWRDRPVSITVTPLDGGAFATWSGAW